ncbi:MAG: 1-(5-phosphoribosyl)-5-[(5-phosphoribosylamino)methylideneamino] imidazole-4-carboxamide isomerase [Alloprevotella sp.]|nr:1-(5-phosphoribosyl)-5-[(5-phosphoribosylamino)methylideneamino] imidazole-4-carboxamide isomerase [Alloprevotella sp.]
MFPIPAIDIIDGQCVRLTRGDYAKQTTYASSPADVAKRFEDAGFTRLHVVDLDGAKSRHVVNLRALSDITRSTNLIVDFGGGIKTRSDLQLAFDHGAAMVTVGSVAATHAAMVMRWAEEFGTERFILGADVMDEKIRINGWQEDGGMSLYDFIDSYHQQGFRQVLCTDISRDGTLSGPAVELYQRILKRYPDLYLIASGGVGGMADLHALERAGIPATVFGKAYYEGRIQLEDLRQFIG